MPELVQKFRLTSTFWVQARVEPVPNGADPGDERLVIERISVSGDVMYPLVHLDKGGFEFYPPPRDWSYGYGHILDNEFRVHNGSRWAQLAWPDSLAEPDIELGLDKMKEIQICL